MVGLFSRLARIKPPAEAPAVQQPAPTFSTQRVVPRQLLYATVQAFESSSRAGVETAVLWAGPETKGPAILTTLVQPALFQTAGNYLLTPEGRRRMARALRDQHLVIYAQVHTHPTDWVGHSKYDDAHAYSTAEGSLSLVWPNYGRSFNQDLSTVGIHVHQNGGWVALKTEEQRRAHLRIVDSSIDLRWEIKSGEIHEDE